MATTAPTKPMPTTKTAPAGAKPVPGWVRVMRWIFFVGTSLFLVGILAQAALAGRGIFGAGTFDAHIGLGWPLAHMLGPLMLIVSLFCRMGLTNHILAAVSYVLAAVVPIFAAMKMDNPEVAALHPLSALVTFGLLFYVVLRIHPVVLHKAKGPGMAA